MQHNNNNASNADELDNLTSEVATLEKSDASVADAHSETVENSGFQFNWNDDTHPELLMVYLEETPVQIEELFSLITKIAQDSADKDEKKLASRLAHTIKGGSAIVGITALSEFCYRLETLFDYAGTHQISNEIQALLPLTADCLNSVFDAVQLQQDEPAEFYPLFQKLDDYVSNLEKSDELIELTTPELPDFIKTQNTDKEDVSEETAEEVQKHESSPFTLNWDDDIHPELLMVYLEETPEQIAQLVPLLQKIHESTADKDQKHVASRMAHTIKGASALVGITALSEFAYRLETLLDHSVNHPLSEDLLAVLPSAAQCLETLFSAVELQDEEPTEFYPLFIQLDSFVNNLEESDEELELTAPTLPDFIQNQNNNDSENLSVVADEPLEPLSDDEDLQDITIEIEDIVMNLITIGSNEKGLANNLDEYSAELQRFDLVADISGYPELSILSQWCLKNIEILVQDDATETEAFIESAEVWRWIEIAAEALNEPTDISHIASLSKELMRNEWPEAIAIEDLEKVLIALRHSHTENKSGAVETEIDDNSENVAAIGETHEVISWDQDVHPELLAVYLAETPDQIDSVAALLSKIAKGESTTEDHKKAARIAHTIKGASGVVGIESLANLTHYLEDILDYAVNNQIPEETSELLAEASDCMETLFDNIQHKQAEPEEYHSVLSRLMSFAESLAQQAEAVAEFPVNDEPLFETNHVSTEYTAVSNDFDLNDQQPIANTLDSEAHIRVPVSVIDKLLNLAGELVTTSSQVGDKLANAMRTNQSIKEHDKHLHRNLDELSLTIYRQEKEQKDLFSNLENSDYDSLEMDSYNELHSVASLLSESVIDGQELDNNLTKQLNELNENLRSLGQLNKELSSVILSSRMVSIDTIVPRLERIVRQTCRKTGKQAELLVTGKDIDIDTDILNGLLDPLLHMLRNSIDHGIESPELRQQKNKNAAGLIKLNFERDGNNILMSLEDDGAGIDPEIIYQKAIDKNLITPEQEFSKDDTLNLILQPGFSTQESVTDISGRGVGMDVVNSAVEELKGTLGIESKLGESTRFNLSIPLTLITNATLMVTAADNIVAIPIDTIEQVYYLPANSVIEKDAGVFVKYENTEIEVKSLNQLLAWSDQPIDFSQSLSLLIIKSHNKTYGVYIDNILSSREVVVKPLTPWVSPEKGVLGACHLNDGGVAAVINLSMVIQFDQSKQAKQNKAKRKSTITTPVKPAVKTAKILVVDDSLSNRKALSLIIDKTHYDVISAVDGMDALQIMNENHIDLVFTDLEMPRMNGLELTQAIRAWTDKSNTPIVMITSRTTTKHRELANKAGVDDYLTKPVVTETLLESIDTWLNKKSLVEA